MVYDEKSGERLYFQTYILPQNRGRIHLIPGNAKVNAAANDIFRAYQEQAVDGTIDFRRYPLRAVSNLFV
jgi:hypothetical protein